MANNVITKTLKKLYRYKIALLFITLWAHVSLLNLFFVSYAGPVFLWQENSEPLTILVHISIAVLTTLFYLSVSTIRQVNAIKTVKIADKVWLTCSVILLLSIGFLVF